MAELVAELRACATDSTLVLPPLQPRRRSGPLLLLLAGLLMLGASAGIYFLARGGTTGTGAGANVASAANVQLRAVGSLDPQGTGGEHDERVSLATDGDPSTYWETERYDSQTFGGLKSGVGLVVDAGRPVRLPKLGIESDTPGFSAVIRAGVSPSGPFTDVSSSRTVSGATAFSLDLASPERYYVVWITMLAPGGDRFQAHVNEVTTGAVGAPPPVKTSPKDRHGPGPKPRKQDKHGRGRNGD